MRPNCFCISVLLLSCALPVLSAQAASTHKTKVHHYHPVHHTAQHPATIIRRVTTIRHTTTIRRVTTIQQVAGVGRLIHIYLPQSGKPFHKTNPFDLHMVPRRVSASAPVTGAMNALLAGPKASEKAAGFEELDSAGLSVGSLHIHHGSVSVNFVSAGAKHWLGDLSPGRFKEAVIWTIRKVTPSNHIVVSVNGNPNFDSLKG